MYFLAALGASTRFARGTSLPRVAKVSGMSKSEESGSAGMTRFSGVTGSDGVTVFAVFVFVFVFVAEFAPKDVAMTTGVNCLVPLDGTVGDWRPSFPASDMVVLFMAELMIMSL